MNIKNVPNSPGVLNDIAFRYLKSVEPSDRKEFGDFKQYLTDIRKILIVGIPQGCLIITVRCSSLQILDELWEGYCSGHQPKWNGAKCLVTKEILTEFGLKEAKPTTTIVEKEYRTCRQYFLDLLG